MKRKIFKKLLFLAFFLLLAFATAGIIYTYNSLNDIKRVKISQNDEDLGITLPPKIETPQKMNEIINIALFGIDVRKNKYEASHADSIIIATLDFKMNKIKLSSIMRDTYVKVSGHGERKITEAYAFGGPELTIKTLNENFNLDIRNYVTIDFFNLEKAIDALDGVTLEIKDYEVSEINKAITESANLQKKPPQYIKSSGTQRLNGLQAVAYCRIRNVGNGDFERTSRQRIVLNELFQKIKASGITKYPAVASEIFPMLETSLSKSDILRYGAQILTSHISNVEQQRFPLDGYCKGEIIKGKWVLVLKPDAAATKKQILDYIFEDIVPVPKKPLF